MPRGATHHAPELPSLPGAVPVDEHCKAHASCGRKEGSPSNLQPEYLAAQPLNLGTLHPLMIAGTQAERQCGKQFNQGSRSDPPQNKAIRCTAPDFWSSSLKAAFLCNAG